MKRLFLSLSISVLCFLFAIPARSQSLVKGVVDNEAGGPIQFADVRLLNPADSSLVRHTNSDSSGRFSFENIPDGRYLLIVVFTGMKSASFPEFEIGPKTTEIDAGTFYLQRVSRELNNVYIAAKKPMFEQKIDRMVINVKNSITDAGGTALDVLEKSPGVIVNRQNNSLSIYGKSGVAVMLNGKISYMPMEALIQFLSATSSDNIEKIELITSPPSKFDAAGNGGYINIVFINNPFAGFNGSYFLTGGYGKRPLEAAGFNFNYRNSKINLFVNYSFKQDHYLQPSSGYNQFTKGADIISNTSFSDRDAITKTQNVKMGLDYQVNPSTVISAIVAGYVSHWSMSASNGATVRTNAILDTTIKTLNEELNYWNNIMTNLNLQHTFRKGSVLNFDMNYIYYKDYNPNTYSNSFYHPSGQLIYHEDLRSDKSTPINFRVFSSDYATPISKKITLETGAKISLSNVTNNAGVSKLRQGTWIPDENLSADYLLKEAISAAYTSVSLRLNNKLSLKAGLRYEYTYSNLGTARTPDLINKEYGELFPTFYISKKLDESHNINLSYSRRITRPAFTDLAPFTIFFDPKTFFTGNPALQPAIANSFQTSYTVDNYAFSLTYTLEHNTIESYYFQTQKIDTINNILFLSANNFNKEQYFTASFSLPFIMLNWWSMQNNINLNWRGINTDFNGSKVNYKLFDYRINSTQLFKLSGGFSYEVSGFFASSSYFGTTRFKALYQLNMGLQKKFKNKQDVLRLTANDIFNSGSNYRFTDNLAIKGSSVIRDFNFGLVSYKLSYTHSFGNKFLKQKGVRTTSAEDELNRVHN